MAGARFISASQSGSVTKVASTEPVGKRSSPAGETSVHTAGAHHSANGHAGGQTLGGAGEPVAAQDGRGAPGPDCLGAGLDAPISGGIRPRLLPYSTRCFTEVSLAMVSVMTWRHIPLFSLKRQSDPVERLT